MNPLRAILVLVAFVLSASASADVPASAKAKRLTPVEPPPVSLAVPEEPKAPLAGSCKLANACAEYQGSFAGVDLPALCAKGKGSFGTVPCPSEGSVGTCQQRQEGSEDRIVTRSYAPTDAEVARKSCVSLPRGIFLKSR